jgi:hypothetical protein
MTAGIGRSKVAVLSRNFPRQVEISRAIKAAKACGIDVSGVEVSRGGIIRIHAGSDWRISSSEFEEWDKAGRL